MAKKTGRVSYTFTALIWTGILICLFGMIVTALGLGGTSSIEFTFSGYTLKATHVGLVIILFGALLSGLVAIKLPKNTIVLTGNANYSFTERVERIMPGIALILILLVILGLLIIR